MINSIKKFVFVAFFALPMACTECTKEYILLDGTWEASSFVVDGEDLLKNGVLSNATFEFKEAGKKEGTFTWTFVSATETEVISGKYTLDGKENKINLTSDGATMTFNYDVDKHNLELTGNVDGASIKIEATEQ